MHLKGICGDDNVFGCFDIKLVCNVWDCFGGMAEKQLLKEDFNKFMEKCFFGGIWGPTQETRYTYMCPKAQKETLKRKDSKKDWGESIDSTATLWLSLHWLPFSPGISLFAYPPCLCSYHKQHERLAHRYCFIAKSLVAVTAFHTFRAYSWFVSRVNTDCNSRQIQRKGWVEPIRFN